MLSSAECLTTPRPSSIRVAIPAWYAARRCPYVRGRPTSGGLADSSADRAGWAGFALDAVGNGRAAVRSGPEASGSRREASGSRFQASGSRREASPTGSKLPQRQKRLGWELGGPSCRPRVVSKSEKEAIFELREASNPLGKPHAGWGSFAPVVEARRPAARASTGHAARRRPPNSSRGAASIPELPTHPCLASRTRILVALATVIGASAWHSSEAIRRCVLRARGLVAVATVIGASAWESLEAIRRWVLRARGLVAVATVIAALAWESFEAFRRWVLRARGLVAVATVIGALAWHSFEPVSRRVERVTTFFPEDRVKRSRTSSSSSVPDSRRATSRGPVWIPWQAATGSSARAMDRCRWVARACEAVRNALLMSRS